MLKLKVIILVTAALGFGCNILGPEAAVAPDSPGGVADPDVGFYGYVYDNLGPVDGAVVEWWCQSPCAWPGPEVAYTNADGYFEMPGDDHEYHLVFAGAWKAGYLAVGIHYHGFGPKPAQQDFLLIKEP